MQQECEGMGSGKKGLYSYNKLFNCMKCLKKVNFGKKRFKRKVNFFELLVVYIILSYLYEWC